MKTKTEKNMITRSIGTIPRFGNGHPIPTCIFPGGGYSGETEELDTAVQSAAKAINQAFGVAIEIRFNSHRRSGGAYMLGDNAPGIGAQIDKNKITWNIYCGQKHLKDPSTANEDGGGRTRYFWKTFQDMESCLKWLTLNTKIPS